MGDGLVLESGTHTELIDTDGAYARLVQAQKLREGRKGDSDEDDNNSEEASVKDMEKEAREEIPLGRKNTSRSLASEIIEQKKQATGEVHDQEDLSMFQLFRRMAPLIRDQWKNYLIGSVFASSASYPSTNSLESSDIILQ